jgi:4a-hydroxytetrahydrobiopterin dehydratase
MPTDLTESELSAFASDHPDWVREGESITRVFVFKDFNASLGFVVRVGAASEVADHHPDIDIRWNKVTLVLSTHDQGALTSKDLSLATLFDSYV